MAFFAKESILLTTNRRISIYSEKNPMTYGKVNISRQIITTGNRRWSSDCDWL